jgi:undecaprenyl-phosphate 4-deoxy-4-formamido-L-arabinose transferase
MPDRSISVVVGVYNAAASLRLLLDGLDASLRRMAVPFEVVLVNDGSRDDSWSVIETEAAMRPWLRGIDLSRNFGQHNALLCGIRAARHDVVVTIDDDLQNPPEEIPRLLERLAEGYDAVYGAPAHERHGFLRGRAAAITKLALRRAMGWDTARHVSAFRAFRTYLREAFSGYGSPFVSVDVLLTWGTTRFSHVTVRHDERAAGDSNYTLGKLVIHALNMVTGFTTLPLQIASVLGFAFAAFGLGVLAYVLVGFLVRGGSVPGFPFLASVIAIFSGVQLFALGIIGEYLARMHQRSMDRPPYLVRDACGPAAPRQ